MSNKKKEVIVPVVLGIIILGSMMSLVLDGRMGNMKLIGIFLGFAGGFISIVTSKIRSLLEKKTFLRRVVSSLFSPFGCLILMIYSPSMAAGYFAGAGVSFCFGWAIILLAMKEVITIPK